MKYNAEQTAVIESDARRIVAISSAGSGKSTTLVARINRMISQGVDPKTISAITYTVAAADHLQSKLKFKLGCCSTLHSFCIRIIREHHALAGLPETISVVDDDQREGMVLKIASDMGIKVSTKKMMALLDDSRFIEPMPGKNFQKEELCAVGYHRQMRQHGVLDFTEILYYGLKVAKGLDFEISQEFPPANWFFKHLFVDETQDSSDVDAAIYDALPAESKMLIGDDSQSIYGFRRGSVENLLKWSRSMNWRVFVLPTNYRCGKAIVEASNRLIENNQFRYPKTCVAHNPGGEIEVLKMSVPGQELGEVMNLCMVNQQSASPQTMAVLCRTNRLAGEFSDFLRNCGVKVAEKERRDDPPDWKLTKMLLSLAGQPYNDWLAGGYLRLARGVKEAQKAIGEAARAGISVYDHSLKALFGQLTPISILDRASVSTESRQRVHEAARRLSALGEWTIPDLIALLNSEERPVLGAGVFVGTTHSSKGLEFEICIMAGCEDEFYPGKDEDTEESRRLFYVGMTRAKSRLVITWCQNRGESRGPNLPMGPMKERTVSRFVAESGL